MPECAAVVEDMRADRAVTSDALAQLQPAMGTVVPLPTPVGAREALASPVARRTSHNWRNVAAVVAGLALVGALAFGPVRNAAASLLQIFRVQQVQTISLTQADLQSMQATLESGSGHIDLQSFGEAWVDGATAEPKTVTLEQAQAAVDFPILLPADQPTKPVITLAPARTVRFKLNVAAVNEALTYYGSTQTLPSNLNDKTFSFSMPAIVMAQYGADAAKPDLESGGPGVIYVGQARSPELTVPDGVDVAALRDLLINLPFLPENLRTQLAAIDKWQSTLIIPNIDGTARDVTIDGKPAVVYSPESAARDAREKVGPLPDSTAVIWNDNGVVRAVGGPIDQMAAIALAESTMK